MHPVDWIILLVAILFIVVYGSWKTRGGKDVDDYIRGNRETNWWTIGLSVMATQASAITFLSTPGQAFQDGMGFVQFYFGLPLAMIIICVFFIPLFHRLNVYTAYEFLESRFDRKTRTLTALLFLIQRGLSAGITIYAPSIILSSVLGWDLHLLTVVIGLLVTLYTVSGGTKAVNVTQKQQMMVIMSGMFLAFYIILSKLPEDVNFGNALTIAGVNGKMDILDFSIDPENRYTFWSGITGGLFLALAYFGTDQSQVQRYLSGKSVRESQLGLIFNGLLKVPMQFFILLCGVMVFVFFQFQPSPLHFNTQAEKAILNSGSQSEYRILQSDLSDIQSRKKELTNQFLNSNAGTETKKPVIMEIETLNKEEQVCRNKARELIKKNQESKENNDTDYVFIYFILNYLPRGVVGLLLAVILSAAMSSTASELSALGATTVLDIYKRSHISSRSDNHYLKAGKWFTFAWGIIAILFAGLGSLSENLIQFVNIVGSIFYGNVLGIFLIAFFLKRIGARAVFISALATQIMIFLIYYFAIYKQELLGYLWLNFIGCALVIILSILLTMLKPISKVTYKQMRMIL